MLSESSNNTLQPAARCDREETRSEQLLLILAIGRLGIYTLGIKPLQAAVKPKAGSEVTV